MSWQNEVTIEGNLTRDAEIKYTSGGKALLKFSIAYNEKYMKGSEEVKETSFFDITAWGTVAESNAQLKKGEAVTINGKLKQERWEKDGKTNSKIGIVAFKIELKFKNEKRTGKTEPAKSSDSFTDDIPF